jgi:hypothetical protein
MTAKFYPGWRMSPAQHQLYFRLLGQVNAELKLANAAAREEQRQLIHIRAFGRPGVSAKEIDNKMFDVFMAECYTWLKPDDLNAQLKQAEQPLIRLRYRIRQFPAAYVTALLCSPRFKRSGLEDLDMMNKTDLTALLMMLSERKPVNHHATPKPQTKPEGELVEEPF